MNLEAYIAEVAHILGVTAADDEYADVVTVTAKAHRERLNAHLAAANYLARLRAPVELVEAVAK